jgi:hypothetical protein
VLQSIVGIIPDIYPSCKTILLRKKTKNRSYLLIEDIYEAKQDNCSAVSSKTIPLRKKTKSKIFQLREDIYEAKKENCSAVSGRLVPQYLWGQRTRGDLSK